MKKPEGFAIIGETVADKAIDAAYLDSQPAPPLPEAIANDVAAVYASLQRAIERTLREDRQTTRIYCRNAVDDLRRLERTMYSYLRECRRERRHLIRACRETRDWLSSFSMPTPSDIEEQQVAMDALERVLNAARVRDAVYTGKPDELAEKLDAEENANG